MSGKQINSQISRRNAVKLGLAGALTGVALPRLASASPGPAAQRKVNRSQSEGEPVTLSYFYPVGVAGPLAKVMGGMVDTFNAEHPDVQVEASFTGSYADTSTKVQTAVQGDNPPDVAVLLSTDLQTMLDLDAVLPLDDFIAGSDVDADDFNPAFFQDTQVEDQTWCLPFQRSTPVLYYNKDALQTAGLDPETPPQTWDELVDFSKKIMEADGAKWGVEIPSTTSAYWLFQALAIQAGKNLNGDDRAHVNFNTPEATEALTWMVELSTKNEVMPTGAVDWSAAPTDFSSATTAFLYHSTGSLQSILSQAQFEVGTAFLPKNKQFGAPTGGGNIYIFKDTSEERQQAAWTFLQWMTSTEQATAWSLASGYVPTRISSTESDEWKQYIAETPQATTALDQLQYAKPELTGHQSGQLQKIMDDAIQAAVTEQETPADALENAQQRADSILEQFR